MMAGITSPARPWFRLTTPDPDLAEFGRVKEYLHTVGQRMSNMFLKSNLYNTLPVVYGDLGTFATAPMSVEEDFEDVILTRSYPVGSYMIAKDHRGKVNVFMREFAMTVSQVVEKFATYDAKTGKPLWDNFSSFVKSSYERGQTEQWVYVVHVIKPNPDFNPFKFQSKNKRFISCYYEQGGAANGAVNYITSEIDNDKVLQEKGFDRFPVLVPRWEVTGEDVYGTDCPGITALGDIKGLYIMEKRKAQAVEKLVNPPMVGPTLMKTMKSSILAGEITYIDEREGQKGFRPAHEVNPRVQELLLDIEKHEQRIRRAYYEDLFLMMANSDRRNITAREIEERDEEKLLALGPVLEQLNQDLLDPLIDISYHNMNEQNQLPPPPEELQGMALKVEYVSIMAQAQKLVGLSSVERFTSFAAQVASVDPSVLQKINSDELIDTYAEITSIPPKIVRTDEEVAEIRDNQAKAAQAQATMEALKQGAGAAKQLSETDISGDNALTALAGGLGQ